MFTSVVLSVSRLRFARLLAASVLMGCAASPVREPGALDRKAQAQIVNVVRLELVKGYIFEAVAERMSSHLEEGLAGGAYDQDASLAAFAQHLTEELQEVSHDKHLRVFPLPKSQSSGQQLSREDRQRRRFERLRAAKFGFHKIERLPGNVGYLDLRNFSPASVGRDKAVEAMGFLATTDALIFDLRRNRGGSPSMIQLISSYLFDAPVLLNTIYTRGTDSTTELWTHAQVEGPRMSSLPVYILTSAQTFSAAEAFGYCLQSRKRAVLVGEVTGGGAHRVTVRQWPEWGIGLALPHTRPINPITKTDWEGTGVKPDIETKAVDALGRAHLAAVKALLVRGQEPKKQAALERVREDLEARK